jgi:hypothetical protein
LVLWQKLAGWMTWVWNGMRGLELCWGWVELQCR